MADGYVMVMVRVEHADSNADFERAIERITGALDLDPLTHEFEFEIEETGTPWPYDKEQ